MRRWSVLILVCCAGCTNAPLAGFLDLVAPSHLAHNLDVQPAQAGDPFLTPGVTAPPAGPAAVPAGPAFDGGFTPPPLNPGSASPAPPPVSPNVTPLTIPNA